MDGISLGKLLLIALLIVLLFGTKKLNTLGSDLGNALKGFKKAMSDDDEPKKAAAAPAETAVQAEPQAIEVAANKENAQAQQQERV